MAYPSKVSSLASLVLVASCADPVSAPGTDASDAADTRADVTTASDTGHDSAATTDSGSVDVTSEVAPDVEADVAPPSIGWAILQYPAEQHGAPGSTWLVYGRVFVAGLTPLAGAAAGVEAEAGVGSGDVVDWAWTPAAFNIDVDAANDEHVATLTAPETAGSYRYAFRFRLDGGEWVYADLDSSDDGFDVADAGTLIVSEPPPATVDYAVVRPATVAWSVDAAPATIDVVVYEPGVTDAAGQGEGLVVEVGYAGPEAAIGDYTWAAASYHGDEDGLGDLDNDVYALSLPALAVGAWRVVARVTLGAGEPLLVDANGTADGFAVADAVAVTVSETVVARVDYCRIQYPTDDVVVTAGAETVDLFGAFYEAAVTGETGSHTPALMTAVGFGASGTTPDETWTWSAGTFNGYLDNGFGQKTNDEHRGRLTPPSAGTFAWAWRGSLDGGATWVSCDEAGSTSYDPSRAGVLIVQ